MTDETPRHSHTEITRLPPPVALRNLSDTIYAHLKAIGGVMMKSERSNHTLTPTSLVNEAMVKMLSASEPPLFNNRAHLLAAAALAMRRILVDHARARHSLKRGMGARILSWSDVGHAISSTGDPELLLQLNDIIDKLYETSERAGRIAEYRLFGGMQQREIATVLEVSLPTVEKEWRAVKDFMASELGIERHVKPEPKTARRVKPQ
jgi:RNA polymerase sigma factor (TIGR02999 family)